MEEKKSEPSKQGLSDEDLGIALVDCIMMDRPKQSRTMDALIFTVEHQGKQYRIGVIGQEALESVKKHGYKDANGRIHLVVPQTALREVGCGWINEPY
jgi:hypothetical protein